MFASLCGIFLGEANGFMLEALGKPSSNVPFIMPKRIAETDAFKQIEEHIGSHVVSELSVTGPAAEVLAAGAAGVRAAGYRVNARSNSGAVDVGIREAAASEATVIPITVRTSSGGVNIGYL